MEHNWKHIICRLVNFEYLLIEVSISNVVLFFFTLSLDINECAMQGICDNGRCVNAQGGFKCECNQGYALDGEGKNCLGMRKRNKLLLFMAGLLFLESNSGA